MIKILKYITSGGSKAELRDCPYVMGVAILSTSMSDAEVRELITFFQRELELRKAWSEQQDAPK